MRRGVTFDAIAAEAKRANVPISLDQAAKNAPQGTTWLASRKALVTGLRVRGIDLSDDDTLTVRRPRFSPGAGHPEYTAFADAVTLALQSGDRPVDTDELLIRTNLPDAEVPFGGLAARLKAAGLFHFPGIGWWTAPQWIDPAGILYHCGDATERVRIVMELFNRLGWPLLDSKIAELSEGKVSPRYFNALRAPTRYIRNIGLRMIVPTHAPGIVPMSPPLASNMLALTPADVLTSREHRLPYCLAMVMARHGLAEVRHSQTTRQRRVMRTLRMTLLPRGREELAKLMVATTRDTMELV